MKNFTTLARRSVYLAVWVATAGLHGCGDSDARQEVSSPDDFKHAHVLADEYQQAGDVLDQPADSEIFALSSTSPNLSSGWTPQQFLEAYNVPTTGANGKPPGYGIKIAIITAYHYSNLQYDLNKWASYFSARPITLNIINQAGKVTNSNFALATCLAVQMVNAVSPGATVYVIEAKSATRTDISTAIKTAVNLGVNIVSMPFGAQETSRDGELAHLFLNSNIAFIAATGNNDTVQFPASHPDVIAVGGTTPSAVNPLVETAWPSTGAGMSLYESMPSYQMIPAVQKANTTTHRSIPDLAFNADPQQGVQVYNSIIGGWILIGGTSVSTAFFTSTVAIADQARKAVNKPMLNSIHTSPYSIQRGLYGLMPANGGPSSSAVLNDVEVGYAGGGSYPAGPGYDIATGLGSLDVEKFVESMTNL
ncbi:S8 family serine peptidase [Allohahella marinimesophila]|uniref:S53 family peptidase n=1 Tax=Allohahella marinimesophila TaxID=1054972 RepID=A0ABP7P9K7_9GAMM